MVTVDDMKKKTKKLMMWIIISLMIIGTLGTIVYWYSQQPECVTNADCSSGWVCSFGKCYPTGYIPTCRELGGSVCISEDKCDVASGGVIEAITECPEGTLCCIHPIGGIPECDITTNTGCPEGYYCAGNKAGVAVCYPYMPRNCEDGEYFNIDNHPTGLPCICVVSWTEYGDWKICHINPECRDNSDCPSGYFCQIIDGKCRGYV